MRCRRRQQLGLHINLLLPVTAKNLMNLRSNLLFLGHVLVQKLVLCKNSFEDAQCF
jgi:hypothetical protein